MEQGKVRLLTDLHGYSEGDTATLKDYPELQLNARNHRVIMDKDGEELFIRTTNLGAAMCSVE